LPVLAEVPELAVALELAREVDRATFRLVEALIHLRAHGTAEATTGVSLDHWLARDRTAHPRRPAHAGHHRRPVPAATELAGRDDDG
jgi:hypothetical protein